MMALSGCGVFMQACRTWCLAESSPQLLAEESMMALAPVARLDALEARQQQLLELLDVLLVRLGRESGNCERVLRPALS